MSDGYQEMGCTEWRLVRLPFDGPKWPFRQMKVGESFVETDISKWGALRTKSSSLRRKYHDAGDPRSWTVRRHPEGIVVTRLS